MKNVIQIVCVVVIVVALGAPTVSAGVGYLDESGIVSWGWNQKYQVSNTPAGTDFAAVAAGNEHSLALKSDGSLISWGYDNQSVVSSTPAGTGFAAVTAGKSYSLALKTDGSLVSWGDDSRGQVSGTPVGTGFAAVAAGSEYGVALKTDGSIVSWGSGTSGTPGGTEFVAVAAGGNRGLALKTDGSIVSWDSGASGTPGGTEFAAVAAGGYHSLALKTDGSLVSWGRDYEGQVGGTPSGTGFIGVAGGDYYSLALKTDGSLVSWGEDSRGQVSNTPVAGYYLDIGGGQGHGVALKARDEYEDLVVTGTGARALLQREVSVSDNCTIETMLNGAGAARMNVAGALVLQPGADFSGSGKIDAESIELNGVQVSEALVEACGLDNNDQVSGYGAIATEFHGTSSSSITVSGGSLTAGDVASYSGFSTAGKLHVGGNTVVLQSKGFAGLGNETTVAGGTLQAANGVALNASDNLVGYGTVNGAVSANMGATIAAEGGNLQLGDASAPDGFFSDGRMYTEGNIVTLLDANQAVVGSLTQLGTAAADGTLIAANGLVVEFGKNIVGRGTVNTPNDPLAPLTNNGAIIGDFAGAIVLTGYVKGVGTFDGVTVTGTLSPGLSPTRLYVGNLAIGVGGELLMELGGTAAGSEHDQLFSTGLLTLAGTLDIKLIGGFDPQLGDEFDLFEGSMSGAFVAFELPGLQAGLDWDTSSLHIDGVISVTPEPATLSLLALGGLAVLRRRRRQANTLVRRKRDNAYGGRAPLDVSDEHSVR